MSFWDTSALTPLVVAEPDSTRRRNDLGRVDEIIVWYGTAAEVESALCRRVREGALSDGDADHARERMAVLARGWTEVEPTLRVRERAVRLLRTHPLRAADAFQLAAALAAVDEQPSGMLFLTGDARLAQAAKLEGFLVH